MNRRGFLKGVFGGVTAAGVIVAASPGEIAAFGSKLSSGAPIVLDTPTEAPEAVAPGEHLYNAAGELVAIVSSLKVRQHKIDVTAFGDASSIYLPGRSYVDIVASGVCTLEWHQGEQFPRLRGTAKR